jgi:dTMP kinase
MKKALFVTFEGVDGAGKSTQAQMLLKKIKECGVSVVLTREPGGTRLAEKIRNLLLYDEEIKFSSVTEVLLYAASRAQHVAEVIQPALARGEVVICERFTDSTLAYQGFASGNDLDKVATGGLVPDLTFLLDLGPVEGWARVQERNNNGKHDRIEAKGSSFQEKVRQGYLEIAANNQERVSIINCYGLGEKEIHHKIWRVFLEKFSFLREANQ